MPERSKLAEQAIEAGAVDAMTGEVIPANVAPLPAAADYGMPYRVSDLMPSPEKYAEFEAVDIESIAGRDVIILDADYFESLLDGQGEWAIILFHEIDDPTLKTTATGSGIVLPKLKKLQNWEQGGEMRNLLPVVGRFTVTPSKTRGHSPYVNLI